MGPLSFGRVLSQHPIDASPTDAETTRDGGGAELLLLAQAAHLSRFDRGRAALAFVDTARLCGSDALDLPLTV